MASTNELEWLRYFYAYAYLSMGPASDDIYQMIKESYMRNGGTLPQKYIDTDEE